MKVYLYANKDSFMNLLLILI